MAIIIIEAVWALSWCTRLRSGWRRASLGGAAASSMWSTSCRASARSSRRAPSRGDPQHKDVLAEEGMDALERAANHPVQGATQHLAAR